MAEIHSHRGVNEADARNRGIIEHFRPLEITPAYVRARLAKIFARETAVQIDARVAKFLADETAKPVRPTPPLGQPLGQVKDPLYGLGTHPDIVEQLWRLDSGLPASCRWVVWGYPALAHPLSGVIFAVGFGTIGIAMRLPAGFRDAAPTAPGAVTGRRTSRPQDPNGACSAAVPKPRPAAPPSILPPRQPPSRPHVASAPQRQFTVTLKSTGPDRTKR